MVTSAATSVTPVFQSTSTPASETLLGSSLTGTAFYRLAGPMNLPTTCGSPPCGTVVDGEFILAVNYSLQRATAMASFKTSDGDILNVSIPISISGVPIAVSGNQVTFTGTYKSSDFPLNTGSFSCLKCGPNDTPGLTDQITFSGTINGAQATLTLTGRDNSGGNGGGSVTVTLPQQALPNDSAAAIVAQIQSGGSSARSASFWDVKIDASGRLLQFGPPVGEMQASVGGATNTIAGTAPTAGNLVWGTWTNGSTSATKATITDVQYNTFQPAAGIVEPWITGDAALSLPPSLGLLNFTPIGSVFANPNSKLNSAKLQADFVNQSLQLSINASAPPSSSGTNIYQLNATTGFSPTSARFSAGFNSVTCTGPCNAGVGTPSGSFGGFFAGTQAQGAGLAFSAGFGAAQGPNGVGTGVLGVIAFGR
jgi:FlaG/FlaF family flagellin (archaellin)